MDCEWYEHFKCVFNRSYTLGSDFLFGNNDTSGENDNLIELNHPTDPKEVREAIHKLKSGKVNGCDGILADMLKRAGHTAVQFLTKYFRAVFNEGVYPEEWLKAIIIPISKKGNKNSSENYRGISLLSLISKCYTLVLNQRLVSRAEENDRLSYAQAECRQGYSTTNHIFTCNAIVEKKPIEKRW